MLAGIRDVGEEVCKAYAEKLDNYTGPILLTEEEIQEQIKDIPHQVDMEEQSGKYNLNYRKHKNIIQPTNQPNINQLQDKAEIDFMVEQVSMFAKEIRSKITDWETDLGDGSVGGTK